ncbi:cation:dicarboxylate symporter family transporter [Priestia megaterium]|uniref:cation:dicarboxylate symporter family transporter n=1 Tax=Priestia megaterium TaxID=1404 RepID=UPI002364474D|nr:cation:dicarboxylase symporter family transporter [Priestia megaterium]MDD1515329.1 cation:dicarboxylase symporter family transporter [Priestia megaterium]
MKKLGLPIQILLGLIFGILVGIVFYKNPGVETYLKPLGDIFMSLIKMVVVPIVFSSIVVGIAGLGNAKKLGKLGFRTILYFEIATTIAIIVGLFFANAFQPGTGVNMNNLSQGDISKYVASEQEMDKGSHIDFIINIVPTNIVESMSKGELLPVIFFSVLLGLSIAAMGEKGQPVLNFFKSFSGAMFYMVKYVLKVAPFGVFGLIGVTISKFGAASLIPLGKLIITTYAAYLIFFIIFFGLVAKLFKVNFIEFIKLLKDELILVFSTASAESALPQVMNKLEKYGCPKSIVSFVVPIGYAFNTDGSCIYMALASVFIAQLYGIDMSLSAQITLMLILMITSKGISGVAGGALVVLLSSLAAAGLPLEGLAFIAGIDFLLNMGRATINVFGNALAAVIITKWEKQFDYKKNKDYVIHRDTAV